MGFLPTVKAECTDFMGREISTGLLKCFSCLLFMMGLAAFWQSANCRNNSFQPESLLQRPETGLSLGSLFSLISVFIGVSGTFLVSNVSSSPTAALTSAMKTKGLKLELLNDRTPKKDSAIARIIAITKDRSSMQNTMTEYKSVSD